MSSEIIYHQMVTRLPAQPSANEQDLYFYMAQAGSSNCFEIDYRSPGKCGRRSRAWNLIAMGTRAQVLSTAIMLAGDCEGGMLKIGSASAYAAPEKLIRKVRKLLDEAQNTDLRYGISYKGEPVTLTLKVKDGATDKDRLLDSFRPPEMADFLAAHAERLAQKAFVAYAMANVHGPEMR